jgi:hypothetical protein
MHERLDPSQLKKHTQTYNFQLVNVTDILPPQNVPFDS